MEENKKEKTCKCKLFATCKCCKYLPFFIGFLVTLGFGWLIFPNLMLTDKEQPVWFSHKVHVEEQGEPCETCHYFNEDGSFSGIPNTESCATCHEGSSYVADRVESESGEEGYVMPVETKRALDAETEYMEKYVETGKEVPWLVYQYQPDNVFFSHKAHESITCNTCHIVDGATNDNPVLQENKLTGYSKNTMKMAECESCHAEKGQSNACYVCHK